MLMMETSTARAIHDPAADFYIDAIRRLQELGIPFLVGGAFAFAHYSHVPRQTKDIDVFVKEDDVARVLEAFAALGYETSLPFPHWLGKITRDGHFMDLIFNSGNGVARVDVAGRGDDLVEGVHPGARAVRWRRRAALVSGNGAVARLAAASDALWRLLARAPQPPDSFRLRVPVRTTSAMERCCRASSTSTTSSTGNTATPARSRWAG
jgi:hypothetical protein